MACTYTFDGQTFNTKEALDAYIAANREAITAKYASNLQNQIIGAKLAQQNRELSRSLNEARELESKNFSKEQIFRLTGWERGADNKWRTKLPTDNIEMLYDPIELIEDLTKKNGYTAHLGDVIHYPELYEIYPSMRFIPISLLEESDKANGSMVATKMGKIFIKIHPRLKGKSKQIKETIIHEIQHVIQALEDFNFSPAKAENFSDYFNSHSEVEARAAARMSFVKDSEKEGVVIGKYEDIADEDKLPSTLYSKDFSGRVALSRDPNAIVNIFDKKSILKKLYNNNNIVSDIFKGIEKSFGFKIDNFSPTYEELKNFVNALNSKIKDNTTDWNKVKKETGIFKADITDLYGILKDKVIPPKPTNSNHNFKAEDYKSYKNLSKSKIIDYFNSKETSPDIISEYKKYITTKEKADNLPISKIKQDILKQLGLSRTELLQKKKLIDEARDNFDESNDAEELDDIFEYYSKMQEAMEKAGNFTTHEYNLYTIYNAIIDYRTFNDLVREEGLTEENVPIYENLGFSVEEIQQILSDEDLIDTTIASYNQFLNQNAQGAFDTMQRVIYAVTNPNVSTPLHELAHAWEATLTAEERQQILDWSGHQSWERETSENFARGFEQYLLEGKSKDTKVQGLFDKFATWLKDIYDKVVTGLGLQLNDNMRDIYDRMLGIKEEVASQKFKMPTIEEILEQPNPKPNEPDFGRTSSVQNALNARYYDQKIKDGTMDEAALRQVLKTNGLSENGADAVIFRVNNEATSKLIDQTIPKTKYDKAYLQGVTKAYNEGTLDYAARTKAVKWDKYYQMLDYIGQATPATNEAKVDEFVKKFYLTEAKEVVREPVEEPIQQQQEVKPNNVTIAVDTTSPASLKKIYKKYEGEVVKTTVNNNGEAVGSITAINDGTNLQVVQAEIKPSRQGIGTEAYTQLGEEAYKMGLTLTSDIFSRLSPEAIGLWDKLVAAGQAVKGETNYSYQIKEEEASIEEVKQVEPIVPQTARQIFDENPYILDPNSNIDILNNFSGETEYTVIDVNGKKLIARPFGSFAEAQEALDEINTFNGFETPTNEGTTEIEEPIEEPVVEETGDIQKGDKVVYEGASYKELKGKPIEVTDTHETDANITEGFVKVKYFEHELPLFTLRKATPEEVQTTTSPEGTLTPTYNTIDEIGNGDKVVFQGEEYVVNYKHEGLALDAKGKEITTVLYNISQVKGPKTFDVAANKITSAKPTIQKQIVKNNILTIISQRFQQIFPQIETEIGAFDFDAPARFHNGRVQLNTNYTAIDVQKEGIAHEYMHPVVAALKVSNKYLYDNLVKELLLTQKDILAEVNAKVEKGLYKKEDSIDEALVTFLGREIAQAFDENGVPRDYNSDETIAARKELADLDKRIKKGEEIDNDYYDSVRQKAEQPSFIESKRQTLIQKFFKWWNDIMDFLLGKKVVRPIENFVESANKKSKLFTFEAKDNENYGVEFTKFGDKVNVSIDNTMFKDLTSVETLLQYAPRMSEFFDDNDTYEQYVKEFTELLNEHRLVFRYLKHTEFQGKQPITVGSLHPRMGLNGLVTLMQANLGKQALTPIQYNETELGVIEQLEAYLKLDEEQADTLKKMREKIVKKINALEDISSRRIGEGTKFIALKEDAERLSKMNTFIKDDAEFVAEYIKHGADSINTAYRMFINLKDEIKTFDQLSDTDKPLVLNRVNKTLEQIKQLVGMYDDIRKLYSKYDDTFEQDELTNFQKATSRLELIKDEMKQTLADLATEQIWPTIERNNKSLEAQGYKKYVLSREDVKKLLINGSSKDIGWFAHMLGAPVNSTDTINAAIANSISDALNYVYSNNLESINELVDAYKNFGHKKDQEAYFKANYLRKAQFYDIISRDENGKPTYGYIEKYAFHQDKFYDLYDKDLREFKETLPTARSFEDDEKNKERILAWEAANKDRQKYVNPNYIALKSDKYYQSLYGNYTTYNNKYGETKLSYGIIPQFYDESFLAKWKDKILDLKKEMSDKDNNFKEKAVALGNTIFGEEGRNFDKRGLNLDGTVYRSVNSETTSFKNDAKLNFNLQEVMIDFISDAGNYEAKREVQFNMENIKQLLGGNSFFGIGERTVGTRDFANEFRARRVAIEKLKKLDEEIKNGKVLTPTEQTEYNTIKEQASGNTFKQVYDKLLGRPIKARTSRANKQAVEFINDVFYNEDEFDSHVKIGGRTFDLNKVGGTLGFTQAVVNMSGNVVAGANNLLAGNMAMLIEAHGGKYFTKKDLAKAHAQYTTALGKGQFIADMSSPIKSEITQYGLLFDAIQGEFTNDLGEKLTGNLMKKFINPSSFFLLTHAGEHQIQLTGMLALMNAYKVKNSLGEEISLKDAYEKDQNGRYKLKAGVQFDKDKKQDFVRKLHGISRMLNGNYNDLHKGHLQRYWFGKLALQYRKYLYPAIVARYGQERVDLEKGTVEMGYLRYFFGSFLFKAISELAFKQQNLYKTLTPDQKYMTRKAFFELSAYAVLTLAALAMGSGDPDKMKKLSEAEKMLLFFTIRVHNELGMYHLDAVTESFKQAQHPIASMRFISAFGKTFVQLFHPGETYEQDGNGYKEGDLKLGAKFKKMIPKMFTLPADGFKIDWDNYLSYQALIQQMPR